jgi:shikimate kinase
VGKSIPEIFTNDSENTFRDLEQQVLAQVSAHTRLVVATGGGIVMRSLNWSHLHDGIVVWIDVLVEILYDIMVSEAETSQEVCDRLLSMIQSRITPDRLRQNV